MTELRVIRVPVCWSILAIIIAFGPPKMLAQSQLETTLKQFNSQTVKGYIQPIGDLFGANMNGGIFHSADIPTAGLQLRVDIIAMGSVVGDDQKSYTVQTPAGFTPATFKTATIFGGKKTVVYDPSSGLSYSGRADGIINTSLFPLAVPQLTIGSLYGTNLKIRYIPIPSIGDDQFPSTTLFGIGAQHNISQYLPSVPLALSAGLFYSSLTVGDLLDFKGFTIGAQASKDFSVLELYGGLAWEQSTLNIKYTSTDINSGSPIVDITLDGANNFRFTFGAALNLAIFHIFADANFGSITSFTGGLGFGI